MSRSLRPRPRRTLIGEVRGEPGPEGCPRKLQLVTRNRVPAAALVPIDEYETLEETAEVLSDRDALAALEAGLAEIERGEVVSLSELHTELAERRPSAG